MPADWNSGAAAARPTHFADNAHARAVAQAFDLARIDRDFLDNPYPVYDALRRHAPVHAMGGGRYFLSRHSDCVQVYKDTRLYASDKKAEFAPKFGTGPLFQHHTTSLVFNDPPLHTRVRRIIAGAFTPRAQADLEGPVVTLVDGLLDQLERRGAGCGIADFAAAVPIEVIGNMLGVPHDEREPMRGWSLAILGALEPVLTGAQFANGETAVREFLAYLSGLVAARRAKPGDPDRCVLTRLIVGEEKGERLSETELLHNVIFILNAGHETTTNLIGNGLALLCEWPDERRRLIAEPALIAPAIEEILRCESPNQLGNRMTTAPVTLGGVAVPAGAFLTLGIGAANRDADEFADPDRFDIARTPNRHLAFGSGAHVCVGLNVARLEGRVAIGRLLARFPEYRLAAPPVRGGRARFRGFAALPVALG